MYTIESFILEAKNKSFYELLSFCEKCISETDRMLSRFKGPKTEEMELVDSFKFVSGLFDFLQNEDTKPVGMSEKHFAMTKQIIADLIQRGEL